MIHRVYYGSCKKVFESGTCQFITANMEDTNPTGNPDAKEQREIRELLEFVEACLKNEKGNCECVYATRQVEFASEKEKERMVDEASEIFGTNLFPDEDEDATAVGSEGNLPDEGTTECIAFIIDSCITIL